MAKTKRGKHMKAITNWRGTCPICQKTGVKVLWDKVMNGAALKVCKRCRNIYIIVVLKLKYQYLYDAT